MHDILEMIFIGHVHKWIIIKNSPLTSDTGAIGDRYILQCIHCGNIKYVDAI
jgi:uncharacterized protein CbrC (UPF0167 family)